MNKFLTSNDKLYKMYRTIVQGILAVVIERLADIVGILNVPDVWRPIVVAILMAVLSPIMATIGESSDNRIETLNDDTYEEGAEDE